MIDIICITVAAVCSIGAIAVTVSIFLDRRGERNDKDEWGDEDRP